MTCVLLVFSYSLTKMLVICAVKSSTNITGIQNELKTTGSIIDQSGKILNKYRQREVTDKFLIFFAFAFFIACVLYVIYSRI